MRLGTPNTPDATYTPVRSGACRFNRLYKRRTMGSTPVSPDRCNTRSTDSLEKSSLCPTMNTSFNQPSQQQQQQPSVSTSGPVPASQTASLPQTQPFVPKYISNTVVICPPQRRQQRTFPHPANLVARTPIKHPEGFAEAPWSFPNCEREEDLINQYVVAGRLPDGLPL